MQIRKVTRKVAIFAIETLRRPATKSRSVSGFGANVPRKNAPPARLKASAERGRDLGELPALDAPRQRSTRDAPLRRT